MKITDLRVETCPWCKSNATARTIINGCQYTFCTSCNASWETLPPNEPRDPSEPLLAFKDMCGNCAFRKDSPERKDKQEWDRIMTSLKDGGRFYCHKGVPIKTEAFDDDVGFYYPKLENGKCDTEKMRLCRGYINHAMKWRLREIKHEAAKIIK